MKLFSGEEVKLQLDEVKLSYFHSFLQENHINFMCKVVLFT